MLTDRKGFVEISLSAAEAGTVISAPSKGHIEIDHLEVIPTGGANTLTFTLGSSVAWTYAFDDNQGYVYDNTSPERNTLTGDEATAFTITLSAATAVTGFVLYRIVGEGQ